MCRRCESGAGHSALVAHFVRQSARRMNRPEPQQQGVLTSSPPTIGPATCASFRTRSSAPSSCGVKVRLPSIYLPLCRCTRIWSPPAKAADAGLMTRDELKRQEREAIIVALKHTNGKVSGPHGAAELLGMKPSTLAARISSLGINRRALN